MSMIPPAAAAIAWMQGARPDPLRDFEIKTWAARWVYEHIHEASIYWHAANSGAKTAHGCALDVRFCQGVNELGGMHIPTILPPVVGILGVPTYKVGGESSVQMVRDYLGLWPHEEVAVKGGEGAALFRIKHSLVSERDKKRWSKLYVFTYDGVVPEAMRIDFWHCDEPPPFRFLDALRHRGKAGRTLYELITATPIDQKTWEPILAEYPEQPTTIIKGRARIQSSVYDNKALGPMEIKRAEQAATGPWKKARLYGEHVNVTGAPPWPLEQIERWKALAYDPIFTVPVHIDGIGDVHIEIYEKPIDGEEYYLDIDLSSGVNDLGHCPAGFHVWKYRGRKLVARFNGRLAPYMVGRLAVPAARLYHDCYIDPENNAGWILSVLDGIRDAGYDKVARETYKDKVTGEVSERFGFNTGSNSRREFVGAIQRAIQQDDCSIPSMAVLEAIAGCTIDENNKVIFAKNKGEDVILCGRGLWKTRPEVLKTQTPTLRPVEGLDGQSPSRDRFYELANRKRIGSGARGRKIVGVIDGSLRWGR